MTSKSFIFIIFLFLLGINIGFSQEVFEHVTNEKIYEYLDELAAAKIIDINSAVKPFTRKYIAGKLNEALKTSEKLNKRQKSDLEFYLNEFKLEIEPLPDFKKINIFRKKKNLATSINPIGLFYKDSLFTLSLKPIWGINYFFSEKGSVFHRWGGAEGYA
jgi:hypothetical protein